MAASVGGLKALSVILGGLPSEFPEAVAIVMYLSPERTSMVGERFNKRTALPVEEARTGDVDLVLLEGITTKLLEYVTRLYPAGSNAAMLPIG